MRERQRDDGREKQRWDPARASDAVGSGMPDTVKGGSRPWSQTLVDAPISCGLHEACCREVIAST